MKLFNLDRLSFIPYDNSAFFELFIFLWSVVIIFLAKVLPEDFTLEFKDFLLYFLELLDLLDFYEDTEFLLFGFNFTETDNLEYSEFYSDSLLAKGEFSIQNINEIRTNIFTYRIDFFSFSFLKMNIVNFY